MYLFSGTARAPIQNIVVKSHNNFHRVLSAKMCDRQSALDGKSHDTLYCISPCVATTLVRLGCHTLLSTAFIEFW